MMPRRRLILCGLPLLLGCAGPDEAAVRRVLVPPGASLRAAAESLTAHGVIKAPRGFRAFAAAQRDPRPIKAGTYDFDRGASWRDVLEKLRAGDAVVELVTIPEGSSLRQMIPLLAERLHLPEDSLHAAAGDSAWLRRLGVPTGTLEGYLFPDTYRFPVGLPARQAIAIMLRRFESVWRPEWTARLDTMRMTRHEIITLASIVETEARLAEERPVIAGVYHNRLRAGMRLEADPTVQYAHGMHRQRLLYRHLDIDSPYNTYRRRGLPPGPIASPGAASIEATLYPARVPYRYFVAYPDGHHEFRRTYAEHLTASRAARRAWDAYALAQRRASVQQAGTAQGAGRD